MEINYNHWDPVQIRWIQCKWMESNADQWNSFESSANQLNPMQINEGQWNPMDSSANQWNPMHINGGHFESSANQLTPMQINWIQWTPQQITGIQCNSMKVNGIKNKSMESNATQWNSTESSANQWNTMQINENHLNPLQITWTQCKSMKVNGIQRLPCKSMKSNAHQWSPLQTLRRLWVNVYADKRNRQHVLLAYYEQLRNELTFRKKLNCTKHIKTTTCQMWHENQTPYHNQILFALNERILIYIESFFLTFRRCIVFCIFVCIILVYFWSRWYICLFTQLHFLAKLTTPGQTEINTAS